MTDMPIPQTAPEYRKTLNAVAAPFRFSFRLSLEAKILLVALAVLTLWALAIFTFGIPALVWPMKVIVPSIVLGLVLLTWGM